MRDTIRRLRGRLIERKLQAATVGDERRTGALRKHISALPELAAAESNSSAEGWLMVRRDLRRRILNDDPRRFLQWDVIRRTMFVGNARYIKDELTALRASAAWSKRWKPALREDAIGLPERSLYYLRSSGNLIHHAYSLYRFEQESGRTMDQFKRIVEFGGGYGSLCRLIHRLGFRGEYVIFDLPELSALQQYFLQSVGLPLDDGFIRKSGVRCISDLKTLHQIIASSPDWFFIALWSISETPETLRYEALGSAAGITDYLIAYQDQFGEVNNVVFFDAWIREHKAIKWLSVPIWHLPGNAYLFGTRNL